MSSDAADSATEDGNYVGGIPDECLACIFRFLDVDNRNQCSLVCKQWLRVESESRRRLSLNAPTEIFDALPSIFARFVFVTELSLRCERNSFSVDDDGLVLISIHCRNLTRLSLRGCREITDEGMVTFASNCTNLRALYCGFCKFGSKALNVVLSSCSNLEELTVNGLSRIHEHSAVIVPGAAASSLKLLSLRKLANGQCFEPLIIGSKQLEILKIVRCLGYWDGLLQMIGNRHEINDYNSSLTEIYLEKLRVSDRGLMAISTCPNIKSLCINITEGFSNLGLVCIAKNCRLLRKLEIIGKRLTRIGDEGLIAVAKYCSDLKKLVLNGVKATHLSLALIARNCQKLESLTLCNSITIGDVEIASIAKNCTVLKELFIHECPISEIGFQALTWCCPNWVKIEVRNCWTTDYLPQYYS